MEQEVSALQESTNLFDVTIPDYKDIKCCRREIVVLKELWDIVVYVQASSLIYNLKYEETEIKLKAPTPHHTILVRK